MSQAVVPSPTGHSLRVRSELLAAALLVGAVWLVYWRSLDVPFICDDVITVVENESIRHLWPLWGDGEQPGPLAPVRDLPTSGRPLVNASFAIDYQLHGLEPRGYRVVNILLHAVNVLLLAALMRRALRLPYFEGRFEAAAGAIAFSAALLWAMHPLVTETVVYVTQRTELIVGCCYLTTLYGSLRFWETRRPGWCLRRSARLLGRDGIERSHGSRSDPGVALRSHIYLEIDAGSVAEVSATLRRAVCQLVAAAMPGRAWASLGLGRVPPGDFGYGLVDDPIAGAPDVSAAGRLAVAAVDPL